MAFKNSIFTVSKEQKKKKLETKNFVALTYWEFQQPKLPSLVS